ncbi:penicillin-binding protein [Candidatus Saccharibacteria bacterium]|nr:penicillin-binding protein [Candidatus Saccharibacteria bacterium]
MKHTRAFKAYKKFKSFSRRKKVAIAGGATALVLLAIPPLTYAYFVRDIGSRERLMNRNNTGIVLEDKAGEPFYSFGRVNQQNDIKLSQISDHLEKAAVASEDKEFYSHKGYSIRSIAGAMYANLLNKDLSRYGGSTITQQLVKNNLLSSDKSFLRKYQEVSIAIAVDQKYSKDEILEMYLNSVYFGEGAFGIGSAAKTYFNKTPQDLDLAESSLLIGILPAPSAYSPISGDPDKAKAQQRRVLEHMVQVDFITAEQKDAALATELTFDSSTVVFNSRAQHFALMVLDELNDRYGEERVTRSGFKVTTSLNLKWQKIAEEQVKSRVKQLEKQGGKNSAVVAIDPRSGEIKALVGSVDWENSEFGKVNMAISPRQPGSSFKPIYYTEAMDKKLITPSTILHDSPKTFGSYKPQNYDFKYMGDITTRRALAQSRNLTAIEVMEKLGVEEAAEVARRMGISDVDEPDKYGLPLALGTAEAKLLDMTNAYAAFANEGKQFKPITVVSIKDKFGKEVYKNKERSKRVQSAEASYLVSSILSDPQARAPTFNSLTIPGKQVAVKTGTTDNNKDAWTIGYHRGIAVGVWLGNNENVAMSGVAGASGAGPIWRGTIQRILPDIKAEDFKQPSRVEKVSVCRSNGLRAERDGGDTYAEYFIRGTAPTQTCNSAEQNHGEDEDKKKEDKREEGEEDDNNTPVLKQCSDAKDNDGDGKIDALDPGCSGPDDDKESDDPIIAQCSDAKDNDGDGLIDMSDPDCSNPEDNSEAGSTPL